MTARVNATLVMTTKMQTKNCSAMTIFCIFTMASYCNVVAKVASLVASLVLFKAASFGGSTTTYETQKKLF